MALFRSQVHKMKTKDITILSVDDSSDDQLLISRAFKANGVTRPIVWVSSGEEAIAYLKGAGRFSDRALFPYPSFIMTDLKMPKGDGFSVLQHLKSTPEWAVIPTVVFSASEDLDDIKRAYMLGAGSYIIKPPTFAGMRECLRVFYDYWMWCETPAIDSTGKRLPTDSKGKLGERFLNQHNNDEA